MKIKFIFCIHKIFQVLIMSHILRAVSEIFRLRRRGEGVRSSNIWSDQPLPTSGGIWIFGLDPRGWPHLKTERFATDLGGGSPPEGFPDKFWDQRPATL